MPLSQAKAIVRPLGFTLSLRAGEYRLVPIAGSPAQREAQAYYTNDLADALATARAAYARIH